MDKGEKLGLGDELFGTRLGEARDVAGPVKGEFVPPPDVPDVDERADALPAQEEFWRPPTRFGSVPVEKEPLGWDRRKGFRKLFPAVYLPFQVVERIQFGHPELEPNRLFWGDNLHVMRQLPSESIDLIYIDPPFFSGRQYNVIFGDQNELRSFTDIWEGGLPGYLIWLNARLYEMKRLLRKSGTLAVHLDWHASAYVRVELDKIFGYNYFRNEIVWHYSGWNKKLSNKFESRADTILVYARSDKQREKFRSYAEPWLSKDEYVRTRKQKIRVDDDGREFVLSDAGGGSRVRRYLDEAMASGRPADNVWDIDKINNSSSELIGYPTQKPIELMQRFVEAFTDQGDTVTDFFCGGGSLIAAAQGAQIRREPQGGINLTIDPTQMRRWIACDQSRVAVAITADRLTRQVEEQTGRMFPVPDFIIEHWGVYEARRLSEAPPEQFRGFVLRAFGAVIEEHEASIHGYKGAIPVWVSEPDQKKAVTAADVQAFANAMRKTLRYKQDNLRDGIMLAWAFRPDAMEAAERLRRLEQTDLNFIRLDMIRIDSPRFREHVTSLSTQNADYENFLTFVQPPKVEVGFKRMASRTYKFDVSETVVMNPGGKIINVQWDFDYDKRFSSTPGYCFVRGSKEEPELQAQYEFPTAGRKRIACKVQDDMGGEGLWTAEIEVS